MSMKFKKLLRALSLLVLLSSFMPLNQAALAAAPLPPVDMFQLPWEQGKAWVALDGFDNGSKRPVGSPHNYLNGGAVDFAPHNNMIKGENTSNFWVTAAADGTIVEISKCHLKIAHANGWVTEYQHLANLQVKLGDVVARNQRLAVIANASTQPVCPGSEPPDIPHLHFVLRPNMVGATFAGWEFRYNRFLNSTTFRKGDQTVGLFKPLLNVFDSVPTATPTIIPTSTFVNSPTATSTPPAGPYVSTTVNLPNINVGEMALATVSLNNVPAEGYTSAEFTCTFDANLVETSNIVVANLFGADAVTAMSNPQSGKFILAIAGSQGNKATLSGPVFTFDVKGLQAGESAIGCTARVSKGDNVLTDLPSIGTGLVILGASATPTLPATSTPTPTAATIGSLTPTPVVTVIPTVPANWLTFTDVTFSFQFKYPPQGVIATGGSDSFTRIDLPFVAGTNLKEKYLEVNVAENVNPCLSPLPTPPNQPSETVTINGITFLKQTGADANVGNLHQWVAYSTLRDNVCVSLDFFLHSLNPGNFATPPTVFDFAAESAVFDQIASTYIWLAVAPTATPIFSPTPDLSATPTFTFTPIVSATPVFTATPNVSPTPTALPNGTLSGQVLAAKPVTISLSAPGSTPFTSVTANADGTFNIDVPPQTYMVIASADGFLSAQGNFTVVAGSALTLPTINLPAGDIDNNSVIDPLDAITIGMNYNASAPAAADLNNDGIINVLDLELLARNYRQIGAIAWQ
jgi:murein DD-endopeptidase MepM/ murein hydrolase activator NlpD